MTQRTARDAAGGTDDVVRGALYMGGAALCFACMSALVKAASSGLPNTMVVFFRNATALAILLPWLLKDGVSGLVTRDVPGHLLRGLGGLLSMYCFFFALSRMRVADAMMLNQSLPLFLPVVASVMLKEPIPPKLWRVLLVGFVGMALVVKPGSGVFSIAAVAGAGSALLAAVAQVGIRRLTKTEPVTRIVFYFALIATAGSALPLLGSWVTPEPRLWPAVLGTGVLATGGQIFLTRGYASAPAARVAPFVYTGVLFAGILDLVFWNVLPDALSAAGAVLILGAVVLSLRLRPQPPAGEDESALAR